jgi:signal transduction histidine kinase
MALIGLESSRLQYNATHSASDFAGTVGDGGVCALHPNTSIGESTANLDAGDEERLAERTRIAQELHDTLLQGFFAVSMQLHTAVSYLPADSAAKPRLNSVLKTMDRILEEGRRAVQELRSPNEHHVSLGEAFASVPNNLGFPSAIGFRVVVHGRERELRAGLRHEVYRIGREAIVNAFRHSRATEIETEVEYWPTELRILVRDDGCGIDPQVLQWGRDGHWGLLGMRERAERIGARLKVRSRVANGTEIELSVPGHLAFESQTSNRPQGWLAGWYRRGTRAETTESKQRGG